MNPRKLDLQRVSAESLGVAFTVKNGAKDVAVEMVRPDTGTWISERTRSRGASLGLAQRVFLSFDIRVNACMHAHACTGRDYVGFVGSSGTLEVIPPKPQIDRLFVFVDEWL